MEFKSSVVKPVGGGGGGMGGEGFGGGKGEIYETTVTYIYIILQDTVRLGRAGWEGRRVELIEAVRDIPSPHPYIRSRLGIYIYYHDYSWKR